MKKSRSIGFDVSCLIVFSVNGQGFEGPEIYQDGDAGADEGETRRRDGRVFVVLRIGVVGSQSSEQQQQQSV